MDIKNHERTAHAPTTLEKIMKVQVGKKLSDQQKTFGSSYRRLDPEKPSPTVTRSGYRDFIHPTEHRMLTVRELACLQTFPRDWEFVGVRLDSYSSKRKTGMTQFGQVGNAVPPDLAFALAEKIQEQFFLKKSRKGKKLKWEEYFLALAETAARRSSCSRRQVGAALISERRVVSLGYNGVPAGELNCDEGGCLRCKTRPGDPDYSAPGLGYERCSCLHAEDNALRSAAAFGLEVATLIKPVMFSTLKPCRGCVELLLRAGVWGVRFPRGANEESGFGRSTVPGFPGGFYSL